MPKRPQTHIYLEYCVMEAIGSGKESTVSVKHIELYDKSLVLTSDIKQLPFLVGGGLNGFFDPSIMDDLVASGASGMQCDMVLLNGQYDDALFGDALNYGALYQSDILAIPGRRKDVLLVAHISIMHKTAAATTVFFNDPSKWDFEGEAILYDTLTLLCFTNTDVSLGAGFSGYGHCEAILEIDWKPISTKEMDEFIRESIFARGSGSET